MNLEKKMHINKYRIEYAICIINIDEIFIQKTGNHNYLRIRQTK